MSNISLPEPYVYKQGYIVLPVSLTGLMPVFYGDGAQELQLRDQFHCSLICVKNILEQVAESQSISDGEAEKQVLNISAKLVQKYPVVLERFTDELRLVSKPDGRYTLIVMCQVSNMEAIFRELSYELEIKIPAQPTHVTLYTIDGRPIGLTSHEEVDQYSRRLEGEDLRVAKLYLNFDETMKATS